MPKSVGEGSCSGLKDNHASRDYPPYGNKVDGSMPMASEYEREGVAPFSNCVSHTFSDVEPANIEGSYSVEFDPAKVDARNLAEVNVDDASKMPTIGNSSNPPVPVYFDGSKSLTAYTYPNRTDQPCSESNLDLTDQFWLEMEDLPIHSPEYSHREGYFGLSDVPSPPHTTLEHGKRNGKWGDGLLA